MHRAACLALLAAVVACTSPGPLDVARSYGEALRRRDVEALRRLSAESAELPADALAAHLDANADLVEARSRELANGTPRERYSARLEYEGGVLILVREGDTWKVAVGGVPIARADSPLAALRTLFLAVDSGRAELAARVIPARFRAGLETPGALARHVEAMKPRVERARDRIGELDAGRVGIAGKEARLPYGLGLSVVFEQEDGEWRILDLE